MNDHIKSFFIFIAIGFLAILFDYSTFLIIKKYLNIYLSKFISFIIGTTITYILNKNITFKNFISNSKREYKAKSSNNIIYFYYLISRIPGMVANIIIYSICIRAFLLSDSNIIPFAVSSIFSTFINYVFAYLVLVKNPKRLY